MRRALQFKVVFVFICFIESMYSFRRLTSVAVSSSRKIIQQEFRSCATSVTSGSFEAEIQDNKKLKAPKRIIKVIEDYELRQQQLTSAQIFLAMKTLANLDRPDLLPAMLPHCLRSMSRQVAINDNDIDSIFSMIRLFSRTGLVEEAESMVGSFEAAGGSETERYERFQVAVLPEVALAHIKTGSVFKAQSCLEKLQQLNATIDGELSKNILKQFLMQGRPDSIRKALTTLLEMNEFNDHESVQMLTNYYLRSVDFVTGAVSLRTAPEPTCPEVCFIGRSNVGKSSLINMLCNRKSLAYTSKSPGKTSEFNYFEARGVVGALKEAHRFHLVDLPGVGFARKDKGTRQGWATFLREYVTGRESLRAVYHLVDSRHGLLEADEACFALLEAMPAHVQYVIVLTKADKQGSGEKGSTALNDVLNSVEAAVKKRTERFVPVFLTSSAAKRGGVKLLSHLLDAVAETQPPH